MDDDFNQNVNSKALSTPDFSGLSSKVSCIRQVFVVSSSSPTSRLKVIFFTMASQRNIFGKRAIPNLIMVIME